MDPSPPPDRPPLDVRLSPADLLRWYWTLEELRHLARLLGVRSTGSKTVLTQRLHAALAGQPFHEPTARRAPAAPLSSRLDHRTTIPVGQRCTQQLRAWFTEQVGPGFRFDGAMRAFISGGDGTRTLGGALLHWHQSRGSTTEVIDEQFEHNRFTRRWRADHPGGSREELLDDWRTYRNSPVDDRGRA